MATCAVVLAKSLIGFSPGNARMVRRGDDGGMTPG
jgi:hypothetical protein